MDVLDMLKKDHQTVTKLFQRFKGRWGDRASVVQKVCTELDVHARLEEELFYPAVEAAGDAELGRMIEEARTEHDRVKQQIRTLRDEGDESDQVDARMSALEGDVEHHVTEEEGEMFPRVEEVLDASERTQMARRAEMRKRELMAEIGGTRTSGGAAAGRGRRAAKGPGATSRGAGRTQSPRRKRARRAKTAKSAPRRGRATGTKKRARSAR